MSTREDPRPGRSSLAMGTLKKYLPFIILAAAVLYFRNEILAAVPGPVKSIFRA